jgi:hypothetical protein
MSTWFTRELYRRYLEMSLATRSTDSSLGAGYAYRLLKEHVNAGRYREAIDVLHRLRDGYLQRYDLDIERIDAVAFPAADSITFKEFGERWPFNLCGVWYFLGLIRLLDQGRPELAVQAFGAALKFGLALRRVLNAIGADDLETAHLCREAEIARLTALAQHDPSQALVAFEQLSENPGGLDPATLEAHLQRARSRLLIDLVNLQHYEPAKELIGSQQFPIVEPMTPDATSAAFAWALHLLNDEGEFATASAMLAQVRQSAVAMQSSHPGDHGTTHFLREAEIAWLATLARHDPSQALVAVAELAANPGGLDPATLAAHLQRAKSRLFVDLVNLGHYPMAEVVVPSDEPPAREWLRSDDLAAAFAYGIHLLNYKSDFSAAGAVFGEVWETAHARAAGNDLLWPARFHQALASWYQGDRETAKLIAEEISAPPPNLPPVPGEYQQRISELIAPPAAISV